MRVARHGKPLIDPTLLPELDMKSLSHPQIRLSMSLLGVAALVATLAHSRVVASPPSGNPPSPYYGRWQVDDNDARFSARGRLYRTIDIAPCGRDFCGVSVDDRGVCGASLFRFLSSHRDGTTRLKGHGLWGAVKKNITVDYVEDGSSTNGHALELNLGNGYDFGERGGSMPLFNATYALRGDARCRVR